MWKKDETHLPHAVEDLPAGNKTGVILITYAAVWVELSLQFCTNCSESINLFNPEEKFSHSGHHDPGSPVCTRDGTHLSVLCFPEERIRNH